VEGRPEFDTRLLLSIGPRGGHCLLFAKRSDSDICGDGPGLEAKRV
jgi:hypothetical protein